MKGIVLGYDAEAADIVVRADNGRRYRFLPADWRDRASPRKGDPVDFEPDGDRARDVYLAEPSRHLETARPAAPLSIVASWGPARFFLARPVFTFSLLVLVACLIGAYAIGDVRISVLEAPELISRMSESLDSLIAVSGTDPAPRLGAGVARILLVLLLGLYLVPALALLVAWREFVGRQDRRLASVAGIAAMVLPIGLPLIVALVVQIWVLPGIPDAGARLGRSGVTTPQQVFEVLRLYATGTVLLLFAGAGLWAAAADRISIPLGLRTIDDPSRDVPVSPSRAEPDTFAPQRARQSAGRPAPARGARRATGGTPTAEPTGPIPFLKLGARRIAEAVGSSPPAARQPGEADVAGLALAEDIKTALDTGTKPPRRHERAEAELPPRGGSVWPEPGGLPGRPAGAESAEPPDVPDVDERADQNR